MAKDRGAREARKGELSEKAYKEGIDELTGGSVVRTGDLDEKAIKFLDFLQANGARANEACQHLKQALEGLTRDHVSNWRAYVYSLLKKFDEASYEAMKASEGKRSRPRPKVDKMSPEKEKQDRAVLQPFNFNPSAAEFVPKAFSFNAGAVEFVAKDPADARPS
mmetsp:Transcript_75602/g.198216  ORF Transcript_75602/g.198216 Transcript_75602/m.198216 type:complete len:164 (+) Transcript_75602:69-560(+)